MEHETKANRQGWRCRRGWHKFSESFPYPCKRCGTGPGQCDICHSWHNPHAITVCSVTTVNPWM